MRKKLVRILCVATCVGAYILFSCVDLKLVVAMLLFELYDVFSDSFWEE